MWHVGFGQRAGWAGGRTSALLSAMAKSESLENNGSDSVCIRLFRLDINIRLYVSVFDAYFTD